MDSVRERYGFFVLISNEVKDPVTALRLYRIRDVIEKAFRNIKERLNLRRTLTSSESSLEGKFFVEFVALIYLSYIKKKMEETGLFSRYTMQELLDEPEKLDKYVEYNKHALKNTAENAQVLTLLFDIVGLVAPQDLCYKADLQVGDKIKVFYDGRFHRKTVAKVDKGIILGREEGLLKLDRWIKIMED